MIADYAIDIAQLLKKPYHSNNPHQLSYSLLGDFHECERKFQLNRLLQNPSIHGKEDMPWHIRGTAYGAGIQAYILTGDLDLAKFITWLAYSPELEDLDRVPTISQARTINNIDLSKDKLDAIRARYEIAIFNGKPAIELSFKINIDNKWFYTGLIDIVLFDKELKIYVVLEVKTTLYKIADLRPLYQNSAQALGYSIVLDKIVGAEQNQFGTLYFVCRDKNNKDFIPDIELFPFNKTIIDRLKWFYTLGMDVERLNKMNEMGIFPMRGHSCLKFGKVCTHFGFCSTSAGDIQMADQKDKQKYDFEFNLQDIIDDHLRRIPK